MKASIYECSQISIWRIVFACIIPVILHWSPFITPNYLTEVSLLLKNAYACCRLPLMMPTPTFVNVLFANTLIPANPFLLRS